MAIEFPPLPDDHYGVWVANEMDTRRLQYLVALVGEAKVRRSAAKTRFHPIFVSKLLKRFRVAVPVSVYAPTPVPLYRVYLLVFPCDGVLKIGMSGNWTRRVYAFASRDPEQGWDSDLSVGVNFQAQKRTALDAERAVRDQFIADRRQTPIFVPYGAGGTTEWLSLHRYSQILGAVRAFRSEAPRPLVTLRRALENDHALWSSVHDVSFPPS